MKKEESFTTKECQEIINLSSIYTPLHSSTIFKTKNFNYYYHIVIREETTQWIFDRIKNFLETLYPSNLADQMPCIFLHKYLAGNKFSRHNDATTKPDQILNIGVALNKDYQGGDFLLYNYGDLPDEVVPRDIGKIYTIDSKRDHEVLEITEGERWSLILFLNARELNITITQQLI